MNKFERYLIDNGMHFQGAGQYGRLADKFLQWCKANKLKVPRLKRSQITDYLQSCREQGNKDITLRMKERSIRYYYEYLGTKRNPAKAWIKRKKEHTLPPKAFDKVELLAIYQSLTPRSPVGYRDRCLLGLVLFQGLLRSELWEIRINDLDFEKAEVFVQGQMRTNSRTLKLEPIQMMHLYDYLHKYRNALLSNKSDKETDRIFLSKGSGDLLYNVTTKMLSQIKKNFPQIIDLRHLRASVITNWEKQEGIIEAMHKAGHRYISSTQRYQTNKYEELQEQLKSIHPLESLNIQHY